MEDLPILPPPPLQVSPRSDSAGDLEVPGFIKKYMDIDDELLRFNGSHVPLAAFGLPDGTDRQ